jgi:hypothetical protein
MILALARHIFEHGTLRRFYSQVRKYHYEGGKVYWSMDATPEATGLGTVANVSRGRWPRSASSSP